MYDQNKIYVVGGDWVYANWMMGVEAHEMEAANLVVFSGGEDVNPSLYGKKPHPTTHFNSRRDGVESREFTRAVALKKHIIGICRGSQFVCAMSGGILVQHQSHPSQHRITVRLANGATDEIRVTSTHHQRQYPWNLPKEDFKVLGWCNESPMAYGESDNDDLSQDHYGSLLPEVEIAYYVKTKALGIQSHPEFHFPPKDKAQKDYIGYHRDLLHRHLSDKL